MSHPAPRVVLLAFSAFLVCIPVVYAQEASAAGPPPQKTQTERQHKKQQKRVRDELGDSLIHVIEEDMIYILTKERIAAIFTSSGARPTKSNRIPQAGPTIGQCGKAAAQRRPTIGNFGVTGISKLWATISSSNLLIPQVVANIALRGIRVKKTPAPMFQGAAKALAKR